MFHDFGKFILDGGVAVYGMLFLAAFCAAVIFERVKALFFEYPIKTDAFMGQIRTMIVSDKIEEAIALCAAQGKSLLPKLVRAILERADRDDDSIKNAHEIASMEVIPQITKRLGYLSMGANVATLIGLLGTIHGLIQSFQAVSFADPAQKQTLLAQGISISMNTTAMGLLVAIPVMIIYSVLQSRMNKVLEDVVSSSAKVVDYLLSRNYQPFNEDVAYTSENVPSMAKGSGANVPPMPKRKAA